MKRGKWGWYAGAALLAAGAAVALLTGESHPEIGAVYVRPAYDSSQVLPLVYGDSAASPLARRLVAHLLSRDLRIQVDHVGACATIERRYDIANTRLLACIFHHGGEIFDFSGSGSLTGDCVAKIPTLSPSDSMSAEVGAVLVALRGAWRLILPSVGAARAFVSHRHMMASVIQSNTAACLASMQAWDKPRVREALA